MNFSPPFIDCSFYIARQDYFQIPAGFYLMRG